MRLIMEHVLNSRTQVIVRSTGIGPNDYAPPIGASDLLRAAFFEAILLDAIDHNIRCLTVSCAEEFDRFRQRAIEQVIQSEDLPKQTSDQARAVAGFITFNDFVRNCAGNGTYRRNQDSLFVWYNYYARPTSASFSVWNAYLEVLNKQKVIRCFLRPTFAARAPKKLLAVVHGHFRKGRAKWLFRHIYGTRTLVIQVTELSLWVKGWRRVAVGGKRG